MRRVYVTVDCRQFKSGEICWLLNGGTNNSSNPTKYNEKTKTFTLNAPTKEGYKFLGWTYNDMTEPQKIVTITKGSYGSIPP